MPDRPDKPADSYPDNPWPLLAALAVLAVGVGYAAFGHWRRAALLVAGALMLGGVLRLLLPRQIAGLLVVRRRWIDVTVMLSIGIAITIVAFVVPPAR